MNNLHDTLQTICGLLVVLIMASFILWVWIDFWIAWRITLTLSIILAVFALFEAAEKRRKNNML